MRDLRHHPANRRVVRALHDASDLLEPQRAQRRLLGPVESDAASHLADPDRLLRRRHRLASNPRSARSFPRRLATASALLSIFSPAIVARSTFWGLAVPRDLVRMSCTP